MYFRGALSDECCDETPLLGVFEFELGSDVRSVSIMGGLGFGLREGRECRDIADGEREDGKEESDVRRLTPAPALALPLDDVVASVPRVVGRWVCDWAICIFSLVALVR